MPIFGSINLVENRASVIYAYGSGNAAVFVVDTKS